jgi:hypothetical protein
MNVSDSLRPARHERLAIVSGVVERPGVSHQGNTFLPGGLCPISERVRRAGGTKSGPAIVGSAGQAWPVVRSGSWFGLEQSSVMVVGRCRVKLKVTEVRGSCPAKKRCSTRQREGGQPSRKAGPPKEQRGRLLGEGGRDEDKPSAAVRQSAKYCLRLVLRTGLMIGGWRRREGR